MKEVFCIAAVSLEKTGEWFIAKDANHFVGWVSPADKQFFRTIVGEAGVAVMGKNTYNTFLEKFGKGLPYARNVVYAFPEEGELSGAEITQEAPAELVTRLSNDPDPNIKAIAVIGGSHMYTQFMQAGVVDIFYITVHQNIQFGSGIPLFTDKSVKLPEIPDFKEWLDPEQTVELLTYQISNKKALSAS